MINCLKILTIKKFVIVKILIKVTQLSTDYKLVIFICRCKLTFVRARELIKPKEQLNTEQLSCCIIGQLLTVFVPISQ